MPPTTLPLRRCCALLALCLLAACGTPKTSPLGGSERGYRSAAKAEGAAGRPLAGASGQDVAIYALALIDTGYRFGGRNPEAGVDCSGMVSYIFERAAGLRLSGSAAEIARLGRPVEREQLRPGDLLFFNTRNTPFSHVGVFIGEERFVHAPSSNGRVRIDRLDSRYYAERFEAARSYLD